MADARDHTGLEYRGAAPHRTGRWCSSTASRASATTSSSRSTAPDGSRLHGRVLEIDDDLAVVQVFEGTTGLSIEHDRGALPRPRRCTMPVAREMLGRVFDGLGRPLDGGPPPLAEQLARRQRRADQPVRARLPARLHPDRHLGHRRHEHPGARPEAADLLRQRPAARPAGGADRPPGHAARRRGEAVRASCSPPWASSTTWPSSSTQLPGERRASHQRAVPQPRRRPERRAPGHAARRADPRRVPGLRAGMHVLVVLTDMTNYCEALREVSTARGEVPEPQGLSGLPLQRPGLALRARRPHQGPAGLDHPDPDPDDAERRHHPPDARPDRLHHRGADRARRATCTGKGIYPPIDVLPSPVAPDEGRHRRRAHARRTTRVWPASCMPPTRASRRSSSWPASSAKRSCRRSTAAT